MTADSLDESLGSLRTVEEVAAYLRKSVRTVRRLRSKGLLEGVRVGQSFRYRDSAVEAYLHGQAKLHAPAPLAKPPARPKRHPKYS